MGITHWHGVAFWKWKVKEEDCGICRQPFDGTCPQCKMPGDECPPVWGNCNHHFHMHCIMKWLQQARAQDRCPLCRQPWEIKVSDTVEPLDVDSDVEVEHEPQRQPQRNRAIRASIPRILQLD